MKNQNYRSQPRPTSGHHFSDLFSCPQRAWLHYYGNQREQASDPAYLKALYREGLEYERSVYEEYFPDAYKVPKKINKKVWQDLTIDAMKRGEPYILQGYIFDQKRIGVLDILECLAEDSSSKTGHIYRVGEIKRSSKLYTAHILQAAWYSEMLSDIQGYQPDEVRFYLKGGGIQTVNLQDYADEYESAKAELETLRASRVCPGAFLSKECPSCHWRSVCMPELVASDHLSLVPWISREKAEVLAQHNVRTWVALKEINDSVLAQIGFSEYEITQIRLALQCLEQGSPPLRHPLNKSIFSNNKVVVMEFTDILRQRKAGLKPKPEKIHFEGYYGSFESMNIPENDDILEKELSKILDGKTLLFYGSTDIHAFQTVCKHTGGKLRNFIDIFDLVEDYVHSPVPGIELSVLANHITSGFSDNLIGIDRVKAVRTIVDWIKTSL